MNGTRTRRWLWRDLILAVLLAGVAGLGFLLGWRAGDWASR